MPYYCTVPRCTSMAGKAKNVSFHQFPRDEELAKLWNRILKRGKPYTKYSKVCSLHFKPEDYTITSVGKNKGQWRTLRKDAIPSQNLPSESPVPYTRRPSGCWVPSQPNVTDPLVQQQVAQAIYMQTMLAMQTAGASDPLASGEPQTSESSKPSPSSSSLSEIELLLRRDTDRPKDVTYKCHECSKCFKDPDVFLLHKRTHKNDTTLNIEKENYSANIQDSEETLRANPILANLLKTSMRLEPESNMANILTVENQIMAALASNMEAYIRTLSSMLASQTNEMETENNDRGSDYDETKDDGEEKDVKVKCEDNEFSEDECVDTKEYDTPMDQETDNAHRNITADEEIQNEYKDDILNHFSDQTAGENRVETPIDENRSSETECIDDNYTKKDEISNDLTDTMDEDRGVASDDKNMNKGNIIDDKYTTKEISNDHDTKIDVDRSSASNDISINDDNIRKENHEASNDIHNKSTNYTKTDSPADYEAQIDAIDNDEYANDNKIPNTTENKSTTNENDIYTAEHKLADDTSSNECEANDALVDVNKYSSDANDVIDEMVNGKDGELVQGDFACDSPVVTVENVIEIDIEFET